MKIDINIDSRYTEAVVVINTSSMTDEINEIISIISNKPNIIAGYKDSILKILDENKIIKIYAFDGKVYAKEKDSEYILKLRLYEVESRLNNKIFVRISNSEIINIREVDNFDFSISGTICAKMKDGSISYVSRRYISKLKNILGI